MILPANLLTKAIAKEFCPLIKRAAVGIYITESRYTYIKKRSVFLRQPPLLLCSWQYYDSPSQIILKIAVESAEIIQAEADSLLGFGFRLLKLMGVDPLMPYGLGGIGAPGLSMDTPSSQKAFPAGNPPVASADNKSGECSYGIGNGPVVKHT
jgi:hypothetical protein